MKKFDSRIIEKNLARLVVSANELDAELAKLPDDAENALYISLEEIEAKKS